MNSISKLSRASGAVTAAFTRTDLVCLLGVGAFLGLTLTSALGSIPRIGPTPGLPEQPPPMGPLATAMYALENSDFCPRANWDNWNDASSPAGWLYKPASATSQGARLGQLWRYIGNTNTYRCPLDLGSESALYDNLRDFKFSSYMLNGAVCGYGRNAGGLGSFWINAFLPTDVLVWEADAQVPFYFNNGSSFPNSGIGIRHNDGGHLATFSGAVEAISYRGYSMGVANPYKNRYWCAPDMAHVR